MERHDLIVVGAGPSGLSAAIEAARRGLDVVVYDENARPGGQLFKQIHKFFGSKEHRARERGFHIGEDLLEEARAAGVRVVLDAVVLGLYAQREVVVRRGDAVFHAKADAVLVATGASENTLAFPGWTLPGVIGAGAAQTMMNLHGVKPGERVLMVGSGNVGLVVSYQLLQAGCDVVAVVDAAPRVGGYGVHAAKVARCGVPFLLSHTVVRAEGDSCVNGVVVAEVDDAWQVVPGTERRFDVDTVCLAVGLSPMSQLLQQAGCDMVDDPARGGLVPVCAPDGATSVPGIYCSGDVAGIEEASSAMIEGRIAGIAIASYLGYLGDAECTEREGALEDSLDALRQGMFAPGSRGKAIAETEEGCPVSQNLLRHGYLADDEIASYPGAAASGVRRVHAVVECTQNIPCNPCQDVCPKGCIAIGEHITSLPRVLADVTCSGCGACVANCPGQAIFLVEERVGDGYDAVTIPYEFAPLPPVGARGFGLSRSGEPVCEAVVERIRAPRAFDKTALLVMRVPRGYGMRARFFKTGRQLGTAPLDVEPLSVHALVGMDVSEDM